MDEQLELRQKMWRLMENLKNVDIDDAGEYYKKYLTFMPIKISECISQIVKEEIKNNENNENKEI